MSKRKVYLNHDGGVDDLVSLYLLLKMKDVELAGVSVMDADCYIQPASSATRKIIEKFGSEKDKQIKIALSDSRAVNPFPKDWRMHAFVIDALPILNEKKPLTVEEAHIKAHEDIIRVLKEADEKIDLVFIGPLTDLARALDIDSSIEDKIG
ncbi:MAG: nucleoside hydrolase, partial [Leptotrichiaceae bacterium]|nr:nucleoside hydrolase [Leptotrichiaceae bacterium]